ncbi:ubiquitin-conjugating enzyme E2 28 [Eutrema salsugineum]|uniref:ubiquitin-conjugating enzyme E2 28 n=1 Tax=Eutrema salsugineum TaxID=72664 RepID=UPI000CED31D5|nr:ubiquitin-conjugating enzyme E2 28 [Eutrema salsugineum]
MATPRELMALFHIRRSIKDFEDHSSPFYSTCVKDDDMYEWTATITGTKNTPYEGGVFSLGIHFDPGFLLKAPRMHFNTPIFHPNVSPEGKIFHPMLEKDMVREDAADMFHCERVCFDEHARRWIQLHAMA